MRITVLGLGYVGVISSGCLARQGFDVTGVDLNAEKVDMVNRGYSPILEERIGEFVSEAVASGRLKATTDSVSAVHQSDMCLVCVGTPSKRNGSADLGAAYRVCEQIADALRARAEYHVVVIRSTVMPGTVRNELIPILEQRSGKRAGEGFGVCFNPEFLREGSSVRDFYDPPYTVIGADNDRDAELVRQLYRGIDAPVISTTLETAEMAKFVCNAFHALKITFANEVGILSRGLGVDSHEVMNIVTSDTKLNISPRYLKPGFAFGGSCLPKDVRAISYKAKEIDEELPLTNAILTSNRYQIDRAVNEVVHLGIRRVALLGLTFKAGTDDLRESPNVVLAETLIGKGFDVRIRDESLDLTKLTGANKLYIEKELPHLAALLTESLEIAIEHGDLLILGNSGAEFTRLPEVLRTGQTVLDLAGLRELKGCRGVSYIGIAW